jgi:hypothetical protein
MDESEFKFRAARTMMTPMMIFWMYLGQPINWQPFLASSPAGRPRSSFPWPLPDKELTTLQA